MEGGISTAIGSDQYRLLKLDLFRQMEVEANPGNIITYLEGIRQHHKQRQLHFGEPGRETRRLVVPAGQRAGKSIAAAAELMPGLAIKDRKFWICAPTYKLTEMVFNYVIKWVMEQHVFGENSVAKFRNSKDGHLIEMNWGARVECRSTNTPEKCVGEQLDGLVWDECGGQAIEIWTRYLRPRLANREGWALMISSPPPALNWFREYYLRCDRTDFRNLGWRGVTFSIEDNPFIPKAEIHRIKAETPKKDWLREYCGRFVSSTGLVWPTYVDALWPHGHLYDPANPPFDFELKDCTHYQGIDIGIRHKTGAVWGAVDPENRLCRIYNSYLQREDYHSAHAENIKALTIYPIRVPLISHDATRRLQNRPGENHASPLKEYKGVGINARLAAQDLLAGVSIVGKYLQSTLTDATPHMGVVIDKNLLDVRRQMMSYVWAEPSLHRRSGKPKEVPHKVDDEIADAMRYMLSYPGLRYVQSSWQDERRFQEPATTRKRRGMRGYAQMPAVN